jgi:P-type Ca2+ transporter type 2C
VDGDFARGLGSAEAHERLERDGPNELPAAGRRGAWRLLGDVVLEPMFLLLIACGAIYLALGDPHEALMLLGFVVVVVAITYTQKQRSEKSLEALRDLSSPRALVVRDGNAIRIAGRELVVGDVVLLAEGDRVPADLLLVESGNLTVDESLLTGESVPVLKRQASGPDAGDERLCRVFSGTLVTQGTARGVVRATGERSALGRIGASLQLIATERTPVQQETHRIVTWVAAAGLGLAIAVALAWSISRGDWLHGILAGLTLAMAILPEELPVVLTIFLGLAAWRLARENVLTRSMPAVELLGATTVLCVDKTGTLTMNRMTVRRLWVAGATHRVDRQHAVPLPEEFHDVLEYAVLASHRRAFDPMEAAIAEAGGMQLAGTEHLHGDWRLVEDYPLTRELLAMSRVWQSPDQQRLLVAAKGAPEAIVDLCHLDPERREAIAREVAALASEGLRVLAVARAVSGPGELPRGQHDFDFELAGLVALEDPVRPDVPAAIRECRAAGMRVVMITGDHPRTAMAIAKQAGLATEGGYLTGVDIDALDDAALRARLADTDVFCRVQPDQKLRLVRAFRARGDVVAMTGDGVNDAPALKAAHIGVAMGARGTDVAREAAALVLLNDDFASLVTAVRHGRRVFANLRKAITFVVAVHLPIVGLSVAPVLLGWPMVLMPVHILFLQLIIDPACSIVFEAEPLERDAMSVPPRNPQSRLFDGHVLWRGLVQGAGLFAIVLLAYAYAQSESGSADVARALAFAVLVVANLAVIQANRHWSRAASHSWNAAFGWIAVVTCGLLAVALLVPTIAGLFAFAMPAPKLLAVGALLCAGAFGWFELAKRLDLRRSAKQIGHPRCPI